MGVKVTFLMIAYNAQKTIEKSVRSILNQTEKDIVLLVRNNGSTDATQEILDRIAREDDRLHIYTNKKNWVDDERGSYTKDGVVRIWPIENEELLGEYISIVDSDDTIKPNFVEIMYAEARRVNAEITVCGNEFVNENNQMIGLRLPPKFETKRLERDGVKLKDCFPDFYNVFRTWWAKLFSKEFFLRNYDKAWEAIGGPYSSPFDTITMHKYLACCNSLVTVSEGLYCCLVSGGSTYATPVINTYAVYEMEHLYQSGMALLEKLKIVTTENETFIFLLAVAYFKEKCNGIEREMDIETKREFLSFSGTAFNSQLFAKHRDVSETKQYMMGWVYDVTSKIMERDTDNSMLYVSYLARLHYVKKMLQVEPENMLLYPILLGCLYDEENELYLGEEMLEEIYVVSEYKHIAEGMQRFQKWEAHSRGRTSRKVYYNLKKVSKEREEQIEHQLQKAYEDEEYEKMAELVADLNRINPLNKEAMLYQVYLLLLIGEEECAFVLANTARVLYPWDSKVQLYCWNLINEKGAE